MLLVCADVWCYATLWCTQDCDFYRSPNYITHVDDAALLALTEYYRHLPPLSRAGGRWRATDDQGRVLDLACSHVSHFPSPHCSSHTVGIGMVEAELRRNPQLSRYIVQDCNTDHTLPFGDDSLDLVTCACISCRVRFSTLATRRTVAYRELSDA